MAILAGAAEGQCTDGYFLKKMSAVRRLGIVVDGGWTAKFAMGKSQENKTKSQSKQFEEI